MKRKYLERDYEMTFESILSGLDNLEDYEIGKILVYQVKRKKACVEKTHLKDFYFVFKFVEVEGNKFGMKDGIIYHGKEETAKAIQEMLGVKDGQ